MLLDITELENNTALDIAIDEDFEELNAHALGMLSAKAVGDFILIKGNIDVNMELECSRCLKKFEDTINVKINEKFFKGSKNVDIPRERHLKASDFEEELDGCEEIDLSDLIYQSIIINVPSQPLCDENCEGMGELKKYIKADENMQTVVIPLKMNNKTNE